MKTSTKVLIGLGTSALIGTTVAVLASEKIIGAVKDTKNRYQVKQFVDHKLNGSEEILHVVDGLSDSEIATVVKLLDKMEEGRKKITVTGKSVKEATDDVVQTLTNFVNGFVEN